MWCILVVTTSTNLSALKSNQVLKITIVYENSDGLHCLCGQINRIYDGVDAEARKSQASFQII